MVQRYLDRLVAVAALAAVMGGCLTPLSKADAQGTTDAAAKKKVEQFLGAGLPGKATVHFVDLNGDGVTEALVISGDPQDCGTHGCAANVLDLRGPAAKDIGDFIAWDLQPLSSKTRGWRDISVIGSRNSGRARFNGRVYSISSTRAADPSDPAGVVSAAAPELATTPSATGWEFTYFSGLPAPHLVGSSLGSEPKVRDLVPTKSAFRRVTHRPWKKRAEHSGGQKVAVSDRNSKCLRPRPEVSPSRLQFRPRWRLSVLQPRFPVRAFPGRLRAGGRRLAVADGQGRRDRLVAPHRHGGG